MSSNPVDQEQEYSILQRLKAVEDTLREQRTPQAVGKDIINGNFVSNSDPITFTVLANNAYRGNYLWPEFHFRADERTGWFMCPTVASKFYVGDQLSPAYSNHSFTVDAHIDQSGSILYLTPNSTDYLAVNVSYDVVNNLAQDLNVWLYLTISYIVVPWSY